MQDEQRVRELTLSVLPQTGAKEDSLLFEVIEKGGSGRMFVRVVDPTSQNSWIAMSYSDDRPDNARFASITDFLINHGVSVPKIIGRRESEGFLLVEDLGNVDLGEYENRDWETEQKPAYEASLRAVFPLHQISFDNQPADLPELEFCFDADLYQWEQDYFYNHYVNHFGTEAEMAFRSDQSLVELRDWLSSQPRALVHRDFQSTNVMIQKNQHYLIDYQGMRFGLPEYDVASMIYDPYVSLLPAQRNQLIEYYYQLKVEAGHAESYADYRKRFDACAMQRLMQALGAYGFLGLQKGKKEFLAHIEPARERLLDVGQSFGLEVLLAV